MGALFKSRQPDIGDVRTKRKFLIVPKCIGGEWRWLGRESVVQEYKRVPRVAPGSFPMPYTVECRVDKEWAA